MNYRKITSKIASRLTLPEVYTFYCLAMKSDFETMQSSINEETLADVVGLNVRSIQRHIRKMRFKLLLYIDTTKHKKDGKYFRKNKYRLITDNYILVTERLMELDLSREMKGFLILLKTQCFNHTSRCDYSTRDLALQLNIGKSTVDRYLNEASEKGYIKWNKKD